MKIQEIQFSDFKGIKDLTIQLSGKSAVFFGINGVGKSTILAGINFVLRTVLTQMKAAQTKDNYYKFTDEMIYCDEEKLTITGKVTLDHETHLLQRYYSRQKANERRDRIQTYPKDNYAYFTEKFKKLYLQDESVGMPIFVHYGTDRTIRNLSLRRSNEQYYDKISAIEHALDAGADFKDFFEWYINRETDQVLRSRDKNHMIPDAALEAINHVISAMIGNVTQLRVKQDPLGLEAVKDGIGIRVDMLSDGEKSILALLGDLVRRLVLANPQSDNPLEGTGIVLVDEIELHMHPAWQRKILPILSTNFPNVQFIITTHSPQVLGEVTDDYLCFALRENSNGEILAKPHYHIDGKDVNFILEDYMDTRSVSEKKSNLIMEINQSIEENHFQRAHVQLNELMSLSGADDENYILLYDFLRRQERMSRR